MSGPEFFQTKMGAMFYDSTMPRIAKALERIATQLEAEPEPCSVCGGTGKPLSGGECICGGKGTASEEMVGLRKALHSGDVPDPSWETLLEVGMLLHDLAELDDSTNGGWFADVGEPGMTIRERVDRLLKQVDAITQPEEPDAR